MSAVDLHPEELLDRERGGALSDEERARLDRHCDACAACAFERVAFAEIAEERTVRPEDERRAAALLEEALGRAAIPVTVVASPRHARRVRVAVVACAAALAISGAALAAVRQGWIPTGAPDDAGAATAPAPRSDARRAATEPDAPVPDELGAPAPDETIERDDAIADLEPAPAARPDTPSRPPTIERRSADELFAAANAARRRGEAREALQLYRALQREHAGSDEARVSHVATGNLLLHEQGDARGALAQYDRYLAGGGSGALVLEARVGRALALERLGRATEERRAWELVLREHPSSVHAERARRRLEALP